MTFPFSLGGLVPSSNLQFTDVLTDGAGTPVEVFTNLAKTIPITDRQPFQRGRSTIVLYGRYSVSGGTPSGFAWKVGAGPWKQFTSETISGGVWQGTMTIPHSYAAQGTLQIKPINGLNVTPYTQANITVSDVFVVMGQSNAKGIAEFTQTYTGTNYDWTVYSSGWVDRSASEWPTASVGSCWPAFASYLDGIGLPPVMFTGAQADATGFGGVGAWAVGGATQLTLKNNMNALASKTGGVAAMLMDQGEQDVAIATTKADYKTLVEASITDWRTNTWMATVPFFWITIADGNDATNVEPIRQAVKEMVAASLIYNGPSLLNQNQGTVHYAEDGGGVTWTAGQVETICNNRAGAWFRCVGSYLGYSNVSGAGAPPYIVSAVQGTGGNANKITITFDRDMQNHSDKTGWSVSDTGGATISTSAEGPSPDVVVLTCNQALTGSVTVSFGRGQNAVDGTFTDTGSPTPFPPVYTENFAVT
jgi:Carbohydrate esterase, sialic acid-specific acetylesterase